MYVMYEVCIRSLHMYGMVASVGMLMVKPIAVVSMIGHCVQQAF